MGTHCVDAIRQLAPGLTVLAVDLPGRRDKPGDLHTLSVADCVESVLDDIDSAHLDPDSASCLSVKVQRQYIEALGGVQTLIPVDTCHCLMVSEPERLAQIRVERCRLYS